MFQPGELDALRDVNIFIINLYVKAWFNCTKGISAPNQDLKFIKDVIAYSEIDEAISDIVVKRFSTHLWYLSEETIAFAFFDPAVPDREKKNMVENLNRTSETVGSPRFEVSELELRSFSYKSLSDLVTEKTLKFFDRLYNIDEFHERRSIKLAFTSNLSGRFKTLSQSASCK